jgi:hypothetical protein
MNSADEQPVAVGWEVMLPLVASLALGVVLAMAVTLGWSAVFTKGSFRRWYFGFAVGHLYLLELFIGMIFFSIEFGYLHSETGPPAGQTGNMTAAPGRPLIWNNRKPMTVVWWTAVVFPKNFLWLWKHFRISCKIEPETEYQVVGCFALSTWFQLFIYLWTCTLWPVFTLVTGLFGCYQTYSTPKTGGTEKLREILFHFRCIYKISAVSKTAMAVWLLIESNGTSKWSLTYLHVCLPLVLASMPTEVYFVRFAFSDMVKEVQNDRLPETEITEYRLL